MKFLVFAAFVAITTAIPLLHQGRNIVFNQDGTILITGLTGRQFVIGKQLGYHNQINIDIAINGPSLTKHFLINDQYCNVIDHATYDSVRSDVYDQGLKLKGLKGKSQYDIFYDILKKFEGIVDEDRFNVFLTDIDVAVKKGQICRVIYDLLVNLDELVDDQSYGHYGFNRGLHQYGMGGQGYGMLDDHYGSGGKFDERVYYGNYDTRGVMGRGQSVLGDYLMGYGRSRVGGFTGNMGVYQNYQQGLNGGNYGGYGGYGSRYGQGYGLGYGQGYGLGYGYGQGYGTSYGGYGLGYGQGYGTGYGLRYGTGYGYRQPYVYGNTVY